MEESNGEVVQQKGEKHAWQTSWKIAVEKSFWKGRAGDLPGAI
ncbi:MAG: hypothetical protein AMXMBFR75_09480 [Candidatus Hinthialibacteria bacterium]